jgi:hypothetical protein
MHLAQLNPVLARRSVNDHNRMQNQDADVALRTLESDEG